RAGSGLATIGPCRASRACASASAPHSSAPPPIVPVNVPSGATTIRAPTSRGLEPSARASVTSAAAPCAAMKREMVGQVDIQVDISSRHLGAHGPYGAQYRLRCGWRVKRNRDLRIDAMD